jgi:hypothetical protein
MFRGTKEGRKNATPNPSYKQKFNDVTASSAKYYAEMLKEQVPAAVQAKQKSTIPEKVVVLQTKVNVLPDVVAAFQRGATIIRIEGESAAISKARAAVEMAVGRKTLTRTQSDRVIFVSTVKPKVVNEVKPEVVDEIEKDVKIDELTAISSEADAILNLQPAAAELNELLTNKVESPKKKRTRTKTIKKEITPEEESDDNLDLVDESDIAAAFGVIEANDNDSFGDDSDD